MKNKSRVPVGLACGLGCRLLDQPLVIRSIRVATSGMLAGAVAGAPLALSLGHPRSSVALGMAIGIAYPVGTRRSPQAYVDNLMAAGALAVPSVSIALSRSL
jgi:hypothetical protein